MGHSPSPLRNLRLLCDRYLADRHQIEIVDVLQDPLRSLQDGIRVSPTLVRLAPEPRAEIIGDLGQTDKVLAWLGLGCGN